MLGNLSESFAARIAVSKTWTVLHGSPRGQYGPCRPEHFWPPRSSTAFWQTAPDKALEILSG